MSVRIEVLGDEHVGEVVGLYARDADRWRAEKAWSWRRCGRPWAVGVRQDGLLRGFVAARPSRLRLVGTVYRAAEIGGGGLACATGDPQLDGRALEALLERLARDGVELVFTAVPEEHVSMLQDAGFTRLFEAYGRNLYVGLEKVSSRLSKAALQPVRRFAQEARRMRPKLVDVALDASRLEELTSLFALRDRAEPALSFDKDDDYLRWRYLEDPRADYRLLTYRSRAGQGISAFALVRRFEPEDGRALLHVDDVWTRRDSRRDYAKLVGELALVALAEECDALRVLSVAGSSAEQALVSVGCIRKKVERHLLVKRLGGSIEVPDPFPAQDVFLGSGDLSLYST